MKHKSPRVFIGPVEIANVSAILANALRQSGLKITVVTTGTPPLSARMKYDKVLDFQGLNILQKAFKYLPHFFEFFLRHDAYIFMFGYSLVPYNLDLPVLKLLGKKTVMWFHGSDIRNYEALRAAVAKAGLSHYLTSAAKDKDTGPQALRRKLRRIHMAESWADIRIAQPSFAQLLTRQYHHILLPIDLKNIRYNNLPNPQPVVLHAPSAPQLKGTSYVMEAVDRLRSEGQRFHFHLLRNRSNIEVREMLSGADIAVDQLFATECGMFALEAMAAGCAVLGGNVPEFSGYPRELPVIHTDPDNVYDNLKMLLENPELRRELGAKGRKYVEKYHDSMKIADDIVRLLTETS